LTVLAHLKNLPRRALLAACSLCLMIGAGQAQNYPDKPIRIISPYSAGGLGDTLPRVVANAMTESLGVNVVVENMPGASMVIGTDYVARSKPDGYTILFASSTSMGINVAINKQLRYDPVRDFAPLAIAFSTPLYLVINPKLPVQNVRDLIALAKKEPGRLTFASGGEASSNHLAAEMFKALAGVDVVHVPYKGTGPALIDVIGGHVDFMFAGEGAQHAQQGTLRALGMTDNVRSKAAPEIPTMQEAGVKDYDMSIWFGFVAPADTPKPILDLLSQHIRKALDNPALRNRTNGAEITPSTPQEMAERIPKDIQMWRKLIEVARLKLQ
jgi:tripartite-type tricarboxylate transporter receptor subunit TctC